MASRIPESFIDDLLERVDIVQTIHQRVPLKQAGREYQACCPFHDEKTPSFTVSPQKQFYHCFGCGKHGSAIGFLMDYDGLAFTDAVAELAQSVGMTVPVTTGTDSGHSDKLEQLFNLLQSATSFFQAHLKNHKPAQDYLRNRGLTGEICAQFKMGYAPDAWQALMEHLTAKGASRQQLLQVGLLTENEGRVYDKFRDRIMFPILDRRGRVCGFGGRAMADKGPKYLNSPETPVFHKGRELYGLFQARHGGKPEQLLLVEGYMDVVALSQYGIEGAVAALGTATTEHQVRLLFQTSDNVVCCFDGDRAGRDAAWKALKVMLPQLFAGRQVKFLFMPDGEDPDSMVRKTSATAFREQIQQAEPLSAFLFRHLQEGLEMDTAEGRASLVARSTPLLSRLPEGAYRELLQDQLAELTRHRWKTAEVTTTSQRPRTPKPDYKRVSKTLLRQLAALLVQQPGLVEQLDEVAIQIIQSQKKAAIVLELIDFCRDRPQISTVALLERWREHPAAGLLAELVTWQIPETSDGQQHELALLLRRLHTEQLSTRIDILMTTQQTTGLSAEQKLELRELLTAKQQVQNA